jgi:hypothetical protein
MLKRSDIRHPIRVCVLSAVAACTLLAPSAGATTAPGATTLIPVTLSDANIKVAPDVFTQKDTPNVARYPRGASITFRIANNGAKPASLVLRVLSKLSFYGANQLKRSASTGTITPGRVKRLHAIFAFRGEYEFELVRNGKIVARNPIVIF